ncbi:MAG: right-handed parallel beta-helix repeat-containing protein [Planctomycetota bacterium]
MRRNLLTAFGILFLAALPGCGGKLGDLRGPIVIGPPPILPPSAATQAGLTAMCAGDAVLRVDYVLPGAPFEAALFLSDSRSTVYDAPPVTGPLVSGTGDVESGSLTFTAADLPALIANGQRVFAGFGVREGSTGDFTPVGATLFSRPASVLIHVDSSLPFDPNADGSTPALAFTFLDDALLRAFVLTTLLGQNCNVWIRDGDYVTRDVTPDNDIRGPFLVSQDTNIYGGFRAGFDLADRHPTDSETVLLDGGTVTILEVTDGGGHVVDGLVVDGRGLATEGIDVTDSDCEFRSVRSIGALDNGMRIRQQLDFQNRRRVSLTACDISQNTDDGVGVLGNLEIELDRSTFDANGGAGVDVNDLLALEGATAIFRAFGCRFFGNSLEGIGMDLNTITTAPQFPGGVFAVDIDGCSFERNGLDGLFIDQDYDLFPAWRTEVRVRDSIARANEGAGFRFDADDQGSYVLDRVRASANGGDGLLVSSEPDDPGAEDDLAPGFLCVTSSYFGGNLGFGIHTTEGDKVVLASHTVFAGNQAGGFAADLVAPRGDNPRRVGTAASCILWRQPNPFTNVRNAACFFEDGTNPFNNVPAAFGVVTANAGGALTLAANSGIVAGDGVEVGDDGRILTVTSATPGQLIVTPEPATFRSPDAVFAYPQASVASAVEDLRLTATTGALGTALVAPGDPTARDPGPLGALDGGQPGVFDPFTVPGLRLLQSEPPPPAGVAPTTPIVLTFDRELDVAAFLADPIARVIVPGEPGIQVTASGNQLTVSPPVTGWAGDNVVHLNIGIPALDGTVFGSSLLVPIQLR